MASSKPRSRTFRFISPGLLKRTSLSRQSKAIAELKVAIAAAITSIGEEQLQKVFDNMEERFRKYLETKDNIFNML